MKAELRYRLYGRIIDVIGSVVNRAIPWVGVVFIAYNVNSAVRFLAGRTTFADVGIKFLADFRISEAVAYVFGGGGLLYGLRNRKLRKDNVERMTRRIAQLEAQIDPRRSSSRLTSRGETRPEDKA